MDGLGVSFVSALGSMKPGMTFVSKSDYLLSSSSIKSFILPFSPITRPELAIVFFCGYWPLILGASGNIETFWNTQNTDAFTTSGESAIKVNMKTDQLVCAPSGRYADLLTSVTAFVFGFL